MQRLKVLDVQRRLNSASYARRVGQLIERLDPCSAFIVALSNGPTLHDRGRGEELAPYLRKRFGEHARWVEGAMVTGARYDRIVWMRERVRGEEKRFFLALLLNAADRAELLEHVAARYPGREPEELVTG